MKSLAACLNLLIGCAGGDGNALLNVGPMPTGEIPPDQANRLREIGAWLTQYGERIYGTRGGPYKPGDYGASTRKGNPLYLHIRDWDDGKLKLPPLSAKVLRNRVLTGGQAEIRQTAAGLEISVPERNRQPLDTIVALELDSDALRLPAASVPGPVALTIKAKATASNVYQKQADYGADRAVDGNRETRWAGDTGTTSAWLEVDLGQPRTFNRAVIKQAYAELERVREFALEYLQAGQWKSCYRGAKPGAKLTATFAPVTAQHVRLNITKATDGPTIGEFQRFQTAR